jgi:hypothetical protein
MIGDRLEAAIEAVLPTLRGASGAGVAAQ